LEKGPVFVNVNFRTKKHGGNAKSGLSIQSGAMTNEPLHRSEDCGS